MEIQNILQEEFVLRLKKNPRYSLRAFAQSLDIDAGNLSRLMNGKRNASKPMISKLILGLGLDPEDYAYLTNGNSRPSYKKKDLSMEMFKIISEWYHFAILELINTEDYQHCPDWVSSRLGINKVQAETAMNRLEVLEFIEVSKDKVIRKELNLSTLSKDYTNAALKKLQNCFLEKAIEAQDQTDFEDRHQSTLTFAVPKKDLEDIKEKVNNFRRDIDRYASKLKGKDEVYNLSFSLYPLTDLAKREKE